MGWWRIIEHTIVGGNGVRQLSHTRKNEEMVACHFPVSERHSKCIEFIDFILYLDGCLLAAFVVEEIERLLAHYYKD